MIDAIYPTQPAQFSSALPSLAPILSETAHSQVSTQDIFIQASPQPQSAAVLSVQGQSFEQPTDHISQLLKQTQTMVSALVDDPEVVKNAAQALGPHACFEDVLAYVMMKIARDEERKVTEKIQSLENGGHPGLKGWVAQKAGDLGGVAGGILGAIKGGPAGAAVGQDIGKRLVNTFTGYHSEDSRQIQFEKLKQQMNKLNEIMSCMSNILATMHSTTKNTISNLRT